MRTILLLICCVFMFTGCARDRTLEATASEETQTFISIVMVDIESMHSYLYTVFDLEEFFRYFDIKVQRTWFEGDNMCFRIYLQNPDILRALDKHPWCTYSNPLPLTSELDWAQE